MKRNSIAFLATLLLALSLLAQSAFAASTGEFSVTSANGYPGDTVVISLKVTQNPGVITMGVQVNYDSDVLELQSAVGKDFADASFGPLTSIPFNISWDDVLKPNNTSIGTLAELTFRIKADAAIGDSAVTATYDPDNVFNSSYDNVSFSVVNGKVSVACNQHQYGSWTQTKAPTCTTAGEETRTCSKCGAKETRSVAATGHSWSAWTQSKAPTCEASGTETRTCSRCKQSENRSVAALGHNFSAPTVTKQPTCTQAGEETGTCSRCGKKTTQSVPALGHSYGAWTVTKQADCEHGGEETSTCSRCKEKQTRTVAALGHDFEEPKIVKEPTLSETGLMQGKCKRCGKTTDQVIPCKAADAATGVEVTAETGAFASGTTLSVTKAEKSAAVYLSAKEALSAFSARFELYSVAALQNGAAVQPKKPVTVTLPVPEGYSGNTALYLIGEDGAATEIPAVLSEDGKTVTVEVSSLGQLAVADLASGQTPQVTEPVTTEPVETQTPEETGAPADTGAAPADTTAAPVDSDTGVPREEKTEPGDKTLVVLLIVAVAVIVAEAAVIVMLARKKK
ncbi:MAG: hypothetical protein IJR89_05525 [Clostridia bacterium]|nr:hypothetical protein [Clostridia bacterium]